MTWKIITLGEVLIESAILAETSSPDRRITVRLNVKGVEKRPVGNDKEGATKYFVRKAGQFIYGRQNLHKGAFGIIPAELDGYESSQDLPAFDIAEHCEPLWLIYFLRQGNFYESLDHIARGIGSRRINPKDLYEVKMPLPPLDEQRVLLQTLSATDEAAAALDRDFAHQATLLTRLRQAVLREAVQGRLVPQDATDEPATVLLARIRAEKQRLMKEKKLRADKPLPPLSKTEVPYEVPEGWAWCHFGELGSITGGGTPQKDRSDYWGGTIPWVTPKDMKTHTIYQSIDTLTSEGVAASSTKLLEVNSVLIVVRGMILNRIIPIATNTVPVTINQDMKALLPFIRETTPYIFLCLEALETTILKLVEKSTHGTGKLESPKLYSLPIPFPPLPEQRRIVAKVVELLAHCTGLKVELLRTRQAAEALHAAALREAFMGPVGAVVKVEL